MYLNLLILCGVLSQEIIGSSTEENIKETSDLLVRKKRIIDLTPGGNQAVHFSRVPYIVNIKQNETLNCVGSILSPYHILTANRCILEQITAYKITAAAPTGMTLSKHFITQVIDRPGYFPNDLVLLVIAPRIVLEHSYAKKIDLHIGPLPLNTIGTISGWQHNALRRNGIISTTDLRSIHVPIISHQECANIYQGHFPITDKYICTFDRSHQKRCNVLDTGAPLVVFSHLVGVLVFAGETLGGNYPDVFLNLDYPRIGNWIMSEIAPHSNNQFIPHRPHNPR